MKPCTNRKWLETLSPLQSPVQDKKTFGTILATRTPNYSCCGAVWKPLPNSPQSWHRRNIFLQENSNLSTVSKHHIITQTWRKINEIGREKIERKWSPEKNNEFTTIAGLFPKRLTMRLHKYCRNNSSSDIGVITAELRSESERLPRGGNSTSNRQGARK